MDWEATFGGLSVCDYVTGCAHKFGGPKGVGFLLVPESGENFSSLAGGMQEEGRRAGTEDVPSILAMLAALETCKDGKTEDAEGRNSFTKRQR